MIKLGGKNIIYDFALFFYDILDFKLVIICFIILYLLFVAINYIIIIIMSMQNITI